jgi:poly(ADP-ribose) glycohydrolase
MTKLSDSHNPTTTKELEDGIRKSGNIEVSRSFSRLAEAIQLTDGFFERTLPFVWQKALMAEKKLPEITPLNKAGSLVLTQQQCLYILANAFFCGFIDRPSNNCLSSADMPSINFDELYTSERFVMAEIPKLRMLFNYFERCRQREFRGDPLTHPIHFIRNRVTDTSPESWIGCCQPLIKPVVHPLGQSIDEASGMLQVDFANRIIGGAAIAYGCAQEEIMFSVRPEMIVSRLFCPAMEDNEAIIFIGTEQFSKAKGYGFRLDFGGDHVDTTPRLEDGGMASYITAIDALDFSAGDENQQYTQAMILRELGKALAGFDVDGTPDQVATGNWGCGAFCGDAELKSVIQWIAGSRVRKEIHYYPWQNEKIFSAFPELAEELVDRKVTVGDVASILLRKLKPGRVYTQLKNNFLM